MKEIEYKANQHTDKYFDPNYNQKHENIKENNIFSKGTNIDKKDFVHNIVPFFGSKVKVTTQILKIVMLCWIICKGWVLYKNQEEKLHCLNHNPVCSMHMVHQIEVIFINLE